MFTCLSLCVDWCLIVQVHYLYDSYGPPYLVCNRYLMVPLTLHGTGIALSPYMYVWFPHVKWLHVLYNSYGPQYLIWNTYHMAPHVCMAPTCTICFLWSPHTLYGIGMLWSPLSLHGTGITWSPTCMYGPPTFKVSSCLIWLLWSPWNITLMVPLTSYFIWNRYHVVPHTCTYDPPTCEMSSCVIWLLWYPIAIYQIGIIWSPHMYYIVLMVLTYLIWNRYLWFTLPYMVPPHVKCLHVLYVSYCPHTLHGIGIIWSPTCMYGPPTCEVSSCLIWLLWSPWKMTLMVPPHLIQNWYLMVPHRA